MASLLPSHTPRPGSRPRVRLLAQMERGLVSAVTGNPRPLESGSCPLDKGRTSCPLRPSSLPLPLPPGSPRSCAPTGLCSRPEPPQPCQHPKATGVKRGSQGPCADHMNTGELPSVQEVAPTLGPDPCPLPHPEEGAGVINSVMGSKSPANRPRFTLLQRLWLHGVQGKEWADRLWALSQARGILCLPGL